MTWSLSAEFTSFVIIIIAFAFSQDANGPSSRRSRLFVISLSLAAVSIALNIVCTVLITNDVKILPSIGLLLNSLYYLFSVLMGTSLSLYLLDIMLGHMRQAKCARLVFGLILGINAAFVVMLIVNATFAPNIIFSIGEDSSYQRGPLYQLGYSVVIIELILLLAAYVLNRPYISRHVTRAIRMLPPIVIALVGVQLLYPELLLNGTIFVAAMLVVYINFQSTRVDIDSLTHVGTRTSFYDELAIQAHGKEPFQIIGVSLGDFASVNRRLGHRAGDEVLYRVATWLEEYDALGHVYRYGKVSFALVRTSVTSQNAKKALEDIVDRFDKPWIFGEHRLYLSASCTDIVRTNDAWTPDQIISYLDAAIETAKERHDRQLRFDTAFKEVVDKRNMTTELLKRAIVQRSFYMCYQPIFNVSEQRFTHAEALIRLNDDAGCPVSPEEFIHLAERTGLMEDITAFVLDEVCDYLAEHAHLGIESISVNLSMPQLLSPKLPDYIASVATRHGVDPARLSVEVTERILGEDAYAVSRSLERLANLGITCSLDDFGVGYSNMAAATKLPFSRAKIDRSLLVNTPQNKRDCRIITALVELLHAMGFSVVAEGVETKEQATFFADLGVEEIQGYYFARPLKGNQFETFLLENANKRGNYAI